MTLIHRYDRWDDSPLPGDETPVFPVEPAQRTRHGWAWFWNWVADRPAWAFRWSPLSRCG